MHTFLRSALNKKGKPREVSGVEKKTRAKRKEALRQDEKAGEFTITLYKTVVCSGHFTDDNYSRRKKTPGEKLKSHAVPRVFRWSVGAGVFRHLFDCQADPVCKPLRELSDKAKYRAEKKCSSLEIELEEVKAEM